MSPKIARAAATRLCRGARPYACGGLLAPTGDDPARLRLDPHLERLLPERPDVVHREAGLGLPLVHHLVQHRVLHLGPRVAQQVAAADRDLERPAGAEVDGQLAEPGAHPAREPDRDGPERAAEVLGVEPLVERRPGGASQHEVAGPRALAPDGRGGGGAYSSTGKPRNSRSAPRRSGPGQARSRGTGRSRAARGRARWRSRDAAGARAAREADHDGPIGVSEDPVDVAKAQLRETVREQLVHVTGPDRPRRPRPRPAAIPGGRRSSCRT